MYFMKSYLKLDGFTIKNYWPLGGDKSVKGSYFVTAQPLLMSAEVLFSKSSSKHKR